MFKNILKNKSLKYISFWLASAIFCLFIHLLNNFNLIFGAQLLLAQFFPPIAVSFWSFINLVSYDFLTNNLGIWSCFTSISYFIMSFITSYFVNFNQIKNLKNKTYYLINYLIFITSITIFYDLVTASSGPLVFQQAWSDMLIGQVSFTFAHIVQNCASASIIYGGVLLRHNSHNKSVKLGSRYVAAK